MSVVQFYCAACSWKQGIWSGTRHKCFSTCRWHHHCVGPV